MVSPEESGAMEEEGREDMESETRNIFNVSNYHTHFQGCGVAAVGDNLRATVQLSRERGSQVHQETQVPSIHSSITEEDDHGQSRLEVNLPHTTLQPDNGFETYCRPSDLYQQPFGQQWDPKPGHGTLSYEGDACCQWSIASFLGDVENSVKDLEKAAGPLREAMERFILLTILPKLEDDWGRSSSKNIAIYKVLAQVSCSKNSAILVRHSLQELQHLLCKDNFPNSSGEFLAVEKIMRSSIISPSAVFTQEDYANRSLRLCVYACLLSVLIGSRTEEFTSLAFHESDLDQLKKAFEPGSPIRMCSKKKDPLRYSLEFIHKAIKFLSLPHHKLSKSNLNESLENCRRALNDFGKSVNSISHPFLNRLKKKNFAEKVKGGDWIDLHFILCYLHRKVHSKRRTPLLQTERRAMILMRFFVEAYRYGGGGDDWRFCLLAGSLLSDIAVNNVTKELRTEACACLLLLLTDKKAEKDPVCRSILEFQSSKVMFSPSNPTKTCLIDHMYGMQVDHFAIPLNLHIKHLCWLYRNQSLEMSGFLLNQGGSFFVMQGMFQTKTVAVKVLCANKQDILSDNWFDQSRSGSRLIREAYNLTRLSEKQQHPNIPVLLSYNTESLPCHIVVQYERYGNLLQFIQGRRETRPLLQRSVLLSMLIGVTDALRYMNDLGLIHRAVMAENVLVGDSYICKLSGLHSAQKIQVGRAHANQSSDSGYDYCSGDDGSAEYISTSGSIEEHLPVRWKAPECLLKHRYSPASDIWALGVLTYELLTFGCIPYRQLPDDSDATSYIVNKNVLPREACLRESEYDLMSKTWEWSRNDRISINKFRAGLVNLQQCESASEDETAIPNPPPLSNNAFDPVNHQEEIYQDISDYRRNSSISQRDKKGCLNHNGETFIVQADDLPVKHRCQEGLVVAEKISSGDEPHLGNLLSLNHDNVVTILRVENLQPPTVQIITPVAVLGSLKEYVLNRRCKKDEIPMYLSQVASGLHHLHVNHIVHGDLRADYVNVLAHDKVQVCRLARARFLCMRNYEVNSVSCVVSGTMLPDAIRWSAPEVIQEGHYTHSSDVWAFGVLSWELYTNFVVGLAHLEKLLPYSSLQDDEILSYIKERGPLKRPEGCPDWVYNLMHMCWPYYPVQRPPFIALMDCLTSRKPMESWLMQRWKEQHETNTSPDLNVTQPEDAGHVISGEEHPTDDTIEKMCPDGFFSRHSYVYRPAPTVDSRENVYAEANPLFYDMEEDDVETRYLEPSEALASISLDKETLRTKLPPVDDNSIIYGGDDNPYDDVRVSQVHKTQDSQINDFVERDHYLSLMDDALRNRNLEYQRPSFIREEPQNEPTSRDDHSPGLKTTQELPTTKYSALRVKTCQSDKTDRRQPSKRVSNKRGVDNGNPIGEKHSDKEKEREQLQAEGWRKGKKRHVQGDEKKVNLNLEKPQMKMSDESRATYEYLVAETNGQAIEANGSRQCVDDNYKEQRRWELKYIPPMHKDMEQPFKDAPDAAEVVLQNQSSKEDHARENTTAVAPSLEQWSQGSQDDELNTSNATRGESAFYQDYEVTVFAQV